ADNNHRALGQMRLERLAKLTSGNVGEDEIEDDGIRLMRVKLLQSGLAVGRTDDRVLFRGEHPLQHPLHAGIVFDDKDGSNLAEDRRYGKISGSPLQVA